MNRLQVPRLTVTELLWRERQEAMDHPILPHDIRFEGGVYVIDAQTEELGICPEESIWDWKTFDIRWYTGEHLRTSRLRFIEVIPERLKTQLPDNAIVTVVR